MVSSLVDRMSETNKALGERTDHRLSDQGYLQFLSRGYVTLPSSLDNDYHEARYQEAGVLHGRLRAMQTRRGNVEMVGDNLLAQIPALTKMLDDPAVTGAVESILGPDYALHTHNFVHLNTPADQGFHQDGNLPWNERGHYRAHRPDWLLLFYYPQDVTMENGPTEVITETQYWTRDIEIENDWHRADAIDRNMPFRVLGSDDLAERDAALDRSILNLGISNLKREFLTVPRGTIVLSHYDMFHRGSRRALDGAYRFMYKFHFVRTKEPSKPAWRHESTLDLEDVRESLKPVVRRVWSWSCGEHDRKPLQLSVRREAKTVLFHGQEDEKIWAAYQLASEASGECIGVLASALEDPMESTRRAAAYGLRESGDAALSALSTALTSESASTRRFAAFGLGNVAAAKSGDAINGLIDRLSNDPDDPVRSITGYSLGMLSRGPVSDVRGIVQALISALIAEPNNTRGGGLERSTVRENAAFGLLQLASNHGLSDEEIEVLMPLISHAEDRYVSGLLLEALRCRGNASALESVLLTTLLRSRWNPVPLVDRPDT